MRMELSLWIQYGLTSRFPEVGRGYPRNLRGSSLGWRKEVISPGREPAPGLQNNRKRNRFELFGGCCRAEEEAVGRCLCPAVGYGRAESRSIVADYPQTRPNCPDVRQLKRMSGHRTAQVHPEADTGQNHLASMLQPSTP